MQRPNTIIPISCKRSDFYGIVYQYLICCDIKMNLSMWEEYNKSVNWVKRLLHMLC